MAYQLEKDEFLGPGLRRVASEEVASAVADLEACRPDPQEAVHDTRKRLKKVRAVLRLVRDEVGEGFYERENERYRDIGRMLAPYRDAHVRFAGLRGLVDRHRDLLAHDAFHDVETVLRAQHRARSTDFFDSEERHKALTALRQEESRPDAWPLEGAGFGAIRPGLDRIYRQGAKRMKAAYTEPVPERFHDWRKRVKYLWYHLRILQPAWPVVLKPTTKALHDLSDLLGEAHDLAELAAVVRGFDPPFSNGPAGELLTELIAGRCATLHARARPLGERLYAEDSRAFVDRVETYWRAWRPGDQESQPPLSSPA